MTQNKPAVNPPLWLLAELTYRCPLQCPYCSNPLDFAQQEKELTTEQWIEVFRQARAMGSVQLGFSGGEPLTRKDLPELIRAARDLGFYTSTPSPRRAWTISRSASRRAMRRLTPRWRDRKKPSSRSWRWRAR